MKYKNFTIDCMDECILTDSNNQTYSCETNCLKEAEDQLYREESFPAFIILNVVGFTLLGLLLYKTTRHVNYGKGRIQ